MHHLNDEITGASDAFWGRMTNLSRKIWKLHSKKNSQRQQKRGKNKIHNSQSLNTWNSGILLLN